MRTSQRYNENVSETENNRIQKLLLSEYCDFSDTVLVESPFAETTRDGHGLRQVALGLTPQRLIIAADVFKQNSNHFLCPVDLDPSIESFELVSVYPLDYITLTIFARRHRKTLKGRLIDGRIHYYELGGINRREIFWKIWCDHIRGLLERKRKKSSSLSETSVASSSSTTTVYFLSSEIEIGNHLSVKKKRNVYRIWAHYGGGAGDNNRPTWLNKDLYLGPSYNELIFGYYTPIPVRFAGASLEEIKSTLTDHSPNIIIKKPCQSWPECRNNNNKYTKKLAEHNINDDLCDVLFIRDNKDRQILTSCNCSSCDHCKSQEILQETLWNNNNRESTKSSRKILDDRSIVYPIKKLTKSNCKKKQQQQSPNILISKVSRFGFGVPEKCNSTLILGPSQRCYRNNNNKSKNGSENNRINVYELIESSVRMWENQKKIVDNRSDPPSRKNLGKQHFRRYGLITAAYFFRALGPWSVQSGERESVQGRRTVSAVNVRRQCIEPELRLPVSRRQLIASVSCSALEPGGCSAIGPATKEQVVLFWTPEYWYRPRPAITAYRELRRHLASISDYHHQKTEQRKCEKKFFYIRKRSILPSGKGIMESSISLEDKSGNLLKRIFSTNGSNKKRNKKMECKENDDDNDAMYQLKKLLRLEMRVTVWDLDSTTLAKQLTMIDRDLFIRIPINEIEIIVFQRSSRNAPNLGALVAFGHRITCLTISEIIAVKQIDMRTRMMARLINAADKCFNIGNFHSCRSILAGLQAPPIYRLKSSWSYLRTHHANRYAIMERLCKIYKNPNSSLYRRAWAKAKRNPPCIPYIGDLIIRLLGLHISQFSEKNILSNNSKYFLSKNVTIFPKTISKKSLQDKSHHQQNTNEMSNKNILINVLNKLKCKSYRNVVNEKNDLLSSITLRQQQLARKYFDRWNYITLRSTIEKQDQEKFNKMNYKSKRVLDLSIWLNNCQKFARGYNFSRNTMAREFLLKARYREDRDNFFISLKLEPADI
ncbi:PREDICTED: uncharacterized protein LOC106792265 [Polistes canadensis]|uniref:uncharacterized protein LOC106792265 n=1 Tax=Polistes canadensis TaxID=91411 RepID=UPI000718D3D2|nr:PREDICTED: uncharacterized protein LOC106792265 [Polistes canadensis]